MTRRPARPHVPAFALASLLAMTLTGSVIASDRPSGSSDVAAPQSVGPSLDLVASGLSSPVLVTNARDGSGRLFVVEQTGKVRIIAGGSLLPTPFLDLSSAISSTGEQGLLGLAFPSSYASTGKFYVNFITKSGDTAINEYRVSSDPNVADRSSGRRIITIDQPYPNHNGGNIVFGPNGYLYIGMGDGGSAGDPGNRARNIESLLGKMLRIDVSGTTGSLPYRIPPSNPYVGRAGRDEIYARGLRNPWRFSFDRVTADLWIGDVGQDRYEEVDRSTTTTGRGRGADYGWKVMEGRACYSPSSGCSTAGKVLPVVTYNHSAGDCSVIGGYVYRGSVQTSLMGRYLFGDFCTGRIWSIAAAARAPAARALFLDTNLNVTSFGEGEDGELYVTATDGGVRHVVAP
jgi:glucose/arabinose dehydrogenase